MVVSVAVLESHTLSAELKVSPSEESTIQPSYDDLEFDGNSLETSR